MTGVENNEQTTPKAGGVTGRGFRKGQSGNPGGRPRGFGSLIREETRDGAELVEFMLAIARGKRRAKLETRMNAVSWLADRGFGRAIQMTELTGKDGGPVAFRPDLTKLSVQELDTLERLVDKSTPDS